MDKDGRLDAICIRWHIGEWAWVVWGNEKKGETDLGTWARYGYPLVSDLNGDGWVEIAMVASSPMEHLQIWRFDPKRKKLKVFSKLQALNLGWGTFVWQLFDLDSDGLDEIVAHDDQNSDWFVFRLQGNKVLMHWGKASGRGLDFTIGKEQVYIVTFTTRFTWLLPPYIWIEDKRLRWQWLIGATYSTFWEIPKGKRALTPSKWRKHEAPFDLVIAADIDGDGCDELIGTDKRGRYRFYWFRRAKSGEMQWRSIFLSKRQIRDWTLIKDGNRRGLCIAWDNGVIELLTMSRR